MLSLISCGGYLELVLLQKVTIICGSLNRSIFVQRAWWTRLMLDWTFCLCFSKKDIKCYLLLVYSALYRILFVLLGDVLSEANSHNGRVTLSENVQAAACRNPLSFFSLSSVEFVWRSSCCDFVAGVNRYDMITRG